MKNKNSILVRPTFILSSFDSLAAWFSADRNTNYNYYVNQIRKVVF